MFNKRIIFIFSLFLTLNKIIGQCPANLSISNGATGFWTNTSGGTATVKITAIGAGGGKNTNVNFPGDGQVNTLLGGSGATMIGTFIIPAGATLFAISGQAGGSTVNAGSGGGGSGVVMCGNPSNCASGTILILAGGGGATSGFTTGGGGQVASGSGNGGVNNGKNGSGGGGLNSPGQAGNNISPVTSNNYPSTGGGQVNKTAISAGGIAGYNNGVHLGIAGGNGMGGGGATDGGAYAAGGGGYSGGNGENDTQRATGGGSFNSGTSQINTNGVDGGGANSGSVLIECLSTSCATPSSFTVTGTGAYCPSQSGLAVGLSSSETGVSYQLKNGVTNIGSAVPGTGGALNFGTQTAGTYTVVATRTTGGCTATMTGSAIVTANSAPTASIAVTNNCGNAILNLTTNGTSFAWSNGQIIEDITVSNSGTYLVTVTGANTCTTIASNIAAPKPIPATYVVSGGGAYCSGITSNMTINLSNSEINVNYQLKNGAANVGSTIAGTGSALILGNYSAAGTYTVEAIHTNGGCTASMIGSATIMVNDCIHSGVNLCETFTKNNVDGNSWYHIYNASGAIIASINPNGNNLGTLTANVIDPAGTYVYSSTYFLGRYIEISSSNYPNGAIIPSNYSMRLYYFNTEFNEYKANANTPGATLQDLNIAWASGGTGCGFANYISSSTLQGVISNANITNAVYGTGNNGFYLQFNLNHLTMFLATTDNANVLPIELGDFRGILTGNSTILNWHTLTELNNRGFEIQRSMDGVVFDKIGFINGSGNSIQTTTYRYVDASPKEGLNYYRLKQIDFDDSYSYSKIISVRQEKRKEIVVFPNPSNDIFSLSEYDGLDFRIYNIFGQLIDAKVQNGKIDLSSYPSNIYILEVYERNQKINTLKLTKE